MQIHTFHQNNPNMALVSRYFDFEQSLIPMYLNILAIFPTFQYLHFLQIPHYFCIFLL